MMDRRSLRLRSPSLTASSVAAVAAAMLVAAPVPAVAGGTRSISVSDHEDLDRGETEGAAIESSGRVTVGFAPKRGELSDATSAFSCLGGKDEVLVGTADTAAIHRISLGRRGKSKGAVQSERVVEVPGVVVTAMATLPGGDVVVASLPGGTLRRLDKRGKLHDFATLPVEQVWALKVHDGKLYAGTGPKGELFAMSLAGKDPKVVLDDDDKHIMSLLSVGDTLLVGTAPGARLLRPSDEPGGVLLKDFSGDEIRTMALTRQGLLVAVNTFDNRQLGSVEALTQNLARTSLTGKPPAGDLQQARPPKANAAVYHLDLGPGRDPDRATEAPWDEWFKRDGQYFTSMLALDDTGTVLLASSADGKVYRLRGARDAATVADFEERQTTALCRANKGPIFATVGQGAAAYNLQASSADKALYRSKVFDTKQPSDFGAVVLRGLGPLTARARVGPNDEPDDRWSDWTTIKLTSEPGAGFRGDLGVLSRRRYLQLELGLASPSAEVRDFELFYAPENLAPRLSEVKISRPSFESDGKREPSTKVTIRWKADARDDDDLVYDVRARPEGTGETQWIPLHDDDEPLTKRELSWDLSTVPNGIYEVEVVASDEPTNGATKARTDELRSAPFVVDRQRPRIEDLRVAGGKITATVRDTGGYVHDVAYRIDDGPFHTAVASDGLFDEPSETISIVVPKLRTGTHRVVLRARDSFGNLETAATIATIE
ncbi:MAG: hypothetical protein K0V04_29320 [Deltaproteobacteria bacterium]|nr:hypothetical protein [Deltaproteobacteria bacterium]